MNLEPVATRYPDFDTLAQSVAGQIAADLAKAVEARGVASVVVSGGKSPIKLFEQLRNQRIDWTRVCITLADERWVDAADPDSNERLVREHLLKDAAADARFIAMKNGAPTPDAGAASAWEMIARVPRPFDVLVLGMGDDGHTASLFPGSPRLESALDTSAAAACIGMLAPTAPRARLSLNLSALLDSRRIVLLINGESKWRVYAHAVDEGAIEEMPIRAVLQQKRTPVEVVWAP